MSGGNVQEVPRKGRRAAGSRELDPASKMDSGRTEGRPEPRIGWGIPDGLWYLLVQTTCLYLHQIRLLMSNLTKDSDNNDTVIRIRGLPWQATKDDISKFFSGKLSSFFPFTRINNSCSSVLGCKIKGDLDGIKMTLSNQGRPSGEAYIEFEDDDAYKKALECHKKHMGSRYIEVFPSTRQQMQWMIQRSGIETPLDESDKQASFVRIRGLPFGSRSEDIIKFFEGKSFDLLSRGFLFFNQTILTYTFTPSRPRDRQ